VVKTPPFNADTSPVGVDGVFGLDVGGVEPALWAPVRAPPRPSPRPPRPRPSILKEPLAG
jgi:hypothetical protein